MRANKQVIFLALVLIVAFIAFQQFRGSGANSQIQQEALDYFMARNPGLTGLTARVINFGCHREIEIMQNGQAIARLGWLGPGNIYEIRTR